MRRTTTSRAPSGRAQTSRQPERLRRQRGHVAVRLDHGSRLRRRPARSCPDSATVLGGRAAGCRSRRAAGPRARARRRTARSARRRASAISAIASAERAPPAFSMKLACFGEICAPPIAKPRRPHASSIRPAVSSCSGFLKTLPNVRLFVGCASFRCACIAATASLISSSGRGSSASSAAATTCPWRRPERAVREPELGGRLPASPARVGDERPLEARRRCRRRRRRRSSRRRRRRFPESRTRTRSRPARPPGPGGGRRPAGRRRRRPAVPSSASARASSPPSLRTTPGNPSSATSRFEPSPTTATGRPSPSAHASSSTSSSTVSGCSNQRAGPPVPSVV